MIQEHVKLGFSLGDDSVSPEIKEVFAKRTARTLWLGIKQGHITSQYFVGNCLTIDKMLDDNKQVTLEWLYQELWFLEMIGSNEMDFVKELLPYINGEAEITWSEPTAVRSALQKAGFSD